MKNQISKCKIIINRLFAFDSWFLDISKIKIKDERLLANGLFFKCVIFFLIFMKIIKQKIT